MKLLYVTCLSYFLLLGCNPNASLQPDDLLLDQSQNIRGERPDSIEAILNAPEKEAFRIQDVEDLEDLVESLQVSRLETRKAVYIGDREILLLSGAFDKAMPSGQTLKPREQIDIFWPTDVVNDYIKVKNKNRNISWVKFRNSASKPQVVLLEDFIIPQVSISDSRLIETKDKVKDEISVEQVVIATSEEEVKEITYGLEDSSGSDQNSEPDVLDTNEDQTELIPIDIQPLETEMVQTPEKQESSGYAPKEMVRPRLRPTQDSTIVTEDPKTDLSEAQEFDDPLEGELSSNLAAKTSLRPIARPVDLNTSPPLLAATGLSAEELLTALGIEPVKISSKESTYMSNGRRNIQEVFTNGHKTFSACTFNPAQGSRKSRCYRELVLSEEFANFIGNEGLACASDAAKLVFNSRPSKVLLRTNGGSVNRANKRSLHSRGRALDVFKAFLYFGTETQPKEIVFHKNQTDGSSINERQNYNFYWTFKDCWQSKIESFKKSKACGARGDGVLTYRTNSDHHDHMHISLPVCSSQRTRFNLYDI